MHLEQPFFVDDLEVGEHAPKTPKLDHETYQKRLNQVTRVKKNLLTLFSMMMN